MHRPHPTCTHPTVCNRFNHRRGFTPGQPVRHSSPGTVMGRDMPASPPAPGCTPSSYVSYVLGSAPRLFVMTRMTAVSAPRGSHFFTTIRLPWDPTPAWGAEGLGGAGAGALSTRHSARTNSPSSSLHACVRACVRACVHPCVRVLWRKLQVVVGWIQGTSGRLWEFLPDRTWAGIWSGLTGHGCCDVRSNRKK
jgi:hypothetical protein